MTSEVIDGSFLLYKNRCIAEKLSYDRLKKFKSGNPNLNKKEYFSEFKKYFTINYLAWSFIRSLVPLAEKFNPDLIVVCWDDKGCDYRSEIYSDYKCDRIKVTDNPYETYVNSIFFESRKWLNNNLYKLGILSLLKSGIEADDWSYYVTTKLKSGIHVSDDYDWYLNIVNKDWSLYRPNKKEVITYDMFVNLMNERLPTSKELSPRHKYIIQKACEGDKDEIPRIATPAVALKLAHYILDPKVQVTDKIKNLLESNTENILRNIQLANTSWLVENIDVKKKYNPDELFDVQFEKLLDYNYDEVSKFVVTIGLDWSYINRIKSITEKFNKDVLLKWTRS